MSARAFWLASLLLLACLITGCARPGPDVLNSTGATVPGAKLVKVYVATTRARAAQASNVFTASRAAQLNYAEFTISIPPGHKPGRIEWPKRNRNPATSFVTVSQRLLDRASFEREIAGRRRKGNGDVGVFVHGYNTNFQEALFRTAQMTGDSNLAGAPILFAWPSEAKLSGYVADKDAVTYSRDALAQLLTDLSRQRQGTQITLFGHSMGGWLAMEAVRQLRLAHRDSVIADLNVVLAAPDIDVDVFRAQVAVIGPLSPPMTVLVSHNDKALAMSSHLAGNRERVGKLNVADPRVQEAARIGHVEIVDISSIGGPGGFNHDRYIGLATLYPELTSSRNVGEFRKTGAYVFNSVGNVVSAPFLYSGSALAGR